MIIASSSIVFDMIVLNAQLTADNHNIIFFILELSYYAEIVLEVKLILHVAFKNCMMIPSFEYLFILD
jgi:hypothetical protein